MKKRLVILFALFMLFSLISCKLGEVIKGDKEQENNNQNNNTSEKFDIVMVARQEGIPWFDDMRNGVLEFGEAYSAEVNVRQVAPEGGDSAKQVQIVEDLISQNVDAICVVPVDTEAMKPMLVRAKEKGIIVISHEASSLADTVDYDVEAFDNKDFGVLMFDTLAKAMGGKGEFAAVIGELDQQASMEWFNSGMAHLKENYPEMKMVLSQPVEDNNDDATARKKALELLKAYPNLKGFIGISLTSGSNFASVLRERENRNIKVVSFGMPSVSAPYLKDGYIAQGQIWRPADAGYVACLVALKVLRGDKIEDGANLDKEGYTSISLKEKIIYGSAPLILTSETVDDYPF